MPIDETAIRTAIENAEKERNEIAERITKLKLKLENNQKKLSHLDLFIEHGKRLIREESVEPASQIEPQILSGDDVFLPASSNTRLIKGTVANRARTILKQYWEPMTLADIAKEFHTRGWELSEKNGEEVLRLAMNKHRAIFNKCGVGLYELVKR